ncbi:MAG: DUF1570 domain-containing protein [Phycisphaeraceae bacterium]|nr:DUF1570 domain-containing protein [Phycisphaeraceae bacterium]
MRRLCELVSDSKRVFAGGVGIVMLALSTGCATTETSISTPAMFAESTTDTSSIRHGQGRYVVSRAPWTFEGSAGEVIETTTYRILTTLRPGLLLDRLPIFVESAIAAYTGSFGVLPAPSQRLETYVLATRPQWARLTESLMRERAGVYLRIQRGGYAADGRGVYFDIGVQDTLAIAAHEGWHQYTQTTFRDRLPIWLEEGIAAYMEGYRWDTLSDRPVFLPWSNVERYDALRSARESGKLMPLEALLVSEPGALLDRSASDPLVYYAQVWALVHWLRESDGGVWRASLERLLSDAAVGRMGQVVPMRVGSGQSGGRAMRSTAVFRTYFTDDMESASDSYRRFVERITRPGGKDLVVLGRSPYSG